MKGYSKISVSQVLKLFAYFVIHIHIHTLSLKDSERTLKAKEIKKNAFRQYKL